MSATTDGDRRARRRNMSVDERRREIVLTAAKLFDQYGYAAVSVDHIAEVVGVAKPTLYYYFTSKNDILEAIHVQVSEFLSSRFDDRDGTDISTPEQLFEVIADILEMYVALPGHQRVYVEHQRELSDAARAGVVERREIYRGRVSGLLLRGIQEGVWVIPDPRITMHQILGMCSYSYQWYSDSTFPPPRDVAVVFWRNMMGGIASDSYRASNPTFEIR